MGVTSNLMQRIWPHREGEVAGFTNKYNVKNLVWYEPHHTMESAICREKDLKKWNRAWKIQLIDSQNPDWLDLWREIYGDGIRHSREGLNPSPATQAMDSRVKPAGDGIEVQV